MKIKMMRNNGGDVVGMSTIPEVLMAHYLKERFLRLIEFALTG